MTLAEYMKRNDLDEYEFAKLLQKKFPNNSRTYFAIRKWRNGTREPDWRMMRQIETLTGGKVKQEDWDTERPTPRPRKTIDPNHYKPKIQKLLDKGTSITDTAAVLEISPVTIYRLGFKRPNWRKHK